MESGLGRAPLCPHLDLSCAKLAAAASVTQAPVLDYGSPSRRIRTPNTDSLSERLLNHAVAGPQGRAVTNAAVVPARL